MIQEKQNKADWVESGLIQSGEGYRLAIAGGIYTIKATGRDTAGAYAMVEMMVPPQSGPPPHIHSREVESFYILEGSLSFWLGNRKLTGVAGSLVIAPPGVPHAFKNEGDTPALALALITPAGWKSFSKKWAPPSKRSQPPWSSLLPKTSNGLSKLLQGMELKLNCHRSLLEN